MQHVIPNGVSFFERRTISREAVRRGGEDLIDAMHRAMAESVVSKYSAHFGVKFHTPPNEAFSVGGWVDDMRMTQTYELSLRASRGPVEVWGDPLRQGTPIIEWAPQGLNDVLMLTRYVNGPAEFVSGGRLMPYLPHLEVEQIPLKWVGTNDHTGRRVYAHVS